MKRECECALLILKAAAATYHTSIEDIINFDTEEKFTTAEKSALMNVMFKIDLIEFFDGQIFPTTDKGFAEDLKELKDWSFPVEED